MRIAIAHRTFYTFSKPVFLEPHVMRLHPRGDPFQKPLNVGLDISPTPAGRCSGLDAEGAPFLRCWFDGMTERLELHSRAEVETLLENPFEFLLEPWALSLPLCLPQRLRVLLSPSLEQIQDPAPNDLKQYATNLLRDSCGDTLQFLSLLNSRIFADTSTVVREEPGIRAPTLTLQLGAGSCRDLAVLFMACCRLAGLPARFVSGYFLPAAGAQDPPQHELHAWAEVFLPGAGWRGFDPSHGLAAATRHVALAAAASPEDAAAVTGSFRGTGADAAIWHEVLLEER